MYAKIVVTLQTNEKNALLALAERENRDPRAQAAYIIRQELKNQGLIAKDQPTKKIQSSVQGGKNA